MKIKVVFTPINTQMKIKVVFTPINNLFPIEALTIGKTYDVVQGWPIPENPQKFYYLKDDEGNYYSYQVENFTELSEYRENQIEEILKIN